MPLASMLKRMLIGRAFTTEKSRIKLFGRMDWTLVPSWVFADILQDIGVRKGKEYLYKMGYREGVIVAKEMIKHMGLVAKAGWITQKAVYEVLDFIGFGKPKFLESKVEKNGHHHLILHIDNNPVAEHAQKLFGSKSLVCYWFMGVYSAHAEHEWGAKNCQFKEIKCVCKGSPHCEWESKW